METKSQNHEMELSTLQTQYKALQEKFNQQEIVNNNLIQEMLKAGMAVFRRRFVEIVLTYGLLAATVCWSWYRFDLRFYFMIVSVILFALMGLMEWLSCWKVMKINTNNIDVQTLEEKMKGLRTNFTLLWLMGVFALCLWMMWFIVEIGGQLMGSGLGVSGVLLTGVLGMSIILIIWNIDRLARMIDHLISQTLRLNGSDRGEVPVFHRSGAYWMGLVMLALTLIGLVFKLMHWPFGALIMLASGTAGLTFVWLTCRYLALVAPEEQSVIQISKYGGLLLVSCLVFKLTHWPGGNLLGLVSVVLFAVATIVWLVRRTASK